MATQPTRDPLDAEVERVLLDPQVRARFKDFEKRLAEGKVRTAPNEEVRRRLGLDEADGTPPQ